MTADVPGRSEPFDAFVRRVAHEHADSILVEVERLRWYEAQVSPVGTPHREAMLRRRAERAEADRTKWIKAFNRLEKAVTNHIKDRCIDSDDLVHVHKAVMRDLGPGERS